MRPEILNPLFAEVEVLKGVGPQVSKQLKKLDLTRVVDVLYHLPTGAIERIRAPAASVALLGRIVILELTPYQVRENRSGRGPMCAPGPCGWSAIWSPASPRTPPERFRPGRRNRAGSAASNSAGGGG